MGTKRRAIAKIHERAKRLMPTYEYQCDACDHNFDEFQSMLEEPLKRCPRCGKLKLRRKFGAGGAIIFKGSGFYQTDYRSESYKAAAKAEQESAKPASDKSDKAAANSATDTSSKESTEKPAKAKKKTSKSPS
jgi:putative FmdB family regulatory protein